jgi:Ca-activated chloride channel family protein
MLEHSSDPQLDAQLRDVPLPEGYLDSLKAALVPTEKSVDRMLREVRVPSMISGRLRSIPADAELDAQITSIAPSAGLAQRLYAIPREKIAAYRQRSPGRRMAEAAGLFVAVSIALAAGLLMMISGIFPAFDRDLRIAEQAPSPDQTAVVVSTGDEKRNEQVLPGENESGRSTPSLEGGVPTPNSSLVIDAASSDLLESGADRTPSPIGELATLNRGAQGMLDDVVLMKYGVLGSPQSTRDLLPELETPWIPSARGIEPPLVRGYDRVFFLKNRVSPPIPPGANPALEVLASPLTFDASTYRRARNQLAQGRLPEPAEVRVEDFLAAIDYHYPAAPAGELALRSVAGPSLFGAPGTGLLQVGVQAGPIKRLTKRTSHLVLALDASAGMSRAGRWSEVVIAVERVLNQMTADDHLSLVVFQDDVVQRWEDIGRSEAASVVRDFQRFDPRGGTNLPLGLQQAVSVALAPELAAAQSRRIVLVTDNPSSVPAEQRELVRAMLTSAGKSGVAFDVVDMGDRERTESLVAELAAELNGDFRQVADGKALAWMLVERLTDQSSTVASEAKLTIRFNPRAVAAYRLIGHEANALAAISPPSLEVEIHASDAATALIELWLQPGDEDDVAEAVVTWLAPQTGERHLRKQRISRLQFATTFTEAAPSLQAAAIAAESAELLRGSREAIRQANPSLSKPSWDTILSVAREANPVLKNRPDFAQLVELANQARQTKP